jgi:tetrahydromethanopterin S-methyltransferase subunit F
MRGEAPRADMNNVVIWSVPEADMASADFYVKQSVEATNQAYRALIARNEKLEREGQEQEQAAAAHLEELQRKLDDLA